ncbi:MAG: class I SAM-dependent methyltransferase, partial [Pseudomonadota bacterium]
MDQALVEDGLLTLLVAGVAAGGAVAVIVLVVLRKRYHRAIAEREQSITELNRLRVDLAQENHELVAAQESLRLERDQLQTRLENVERSNEVLTAHPNGHFYSPVVDPAEVSAEADRIWAPKTTLPGLTFSEEQHLAVLNQLFPQFISGFDYPETLPENAEPWTFFIQNSQFSWLDCRLLFVLLNAWRPAQYLEIGSGFSSLLAADVSRRMLDGAMRVTCVEPYPRPFLTQPVPGISEVIVKRVQELPLETFDELQAGDILFIDSSHVAKTGSDVNYLFFEVLPRLAAGVRIHVHDIFFPLEYPKTWVLEENRSWNEQYVLQALLMDSTRYRVFFGSNYAATIFPAEAAKALGREGSPPFGGG